jgi:hypothetical protein
MDDYAGDPRKLVLTRLRELQRCKVGGPMPSWLPVNNWGVPISQLAGIAADLIERPVFLYQQKLAIERAILDCLKECGAKMVDEQHQIIDVSNIGTGLSPAWLRKCIEEALVVSS